MLNFDNFDAEIITSKRIAAVIFTAEWCRPSKLQQEIIPQLVEEFSDAALIANVDVDQDEKLAQRFNARTLPTTVLFAQGEIIEVLPGYQTLDFLQAYLRHMIKQVELEATKPDAEKESEKNEKSD